MDDLGVDKRSASYGRRPAQPYGDGNRAAVTTGHTSPVLFGEEAERVRVELASQFELLGLDVFQPAFERCVAAQARVNLIGRFVWDVAEGRREAHFRKGRPRTGVEAVPAYLWTELSRAEANAQKFAQDCGLDPIGFARVAKELGWAKQLAGEGLRGLAQRGAQLRRGQ